MKSFALISVWRKRQIWLSTFDSRTAGKMVISIKNLFTFIEKTIYLNKGLYAYRQEKEVVPEFGRKGVLDECMPWLMLCLSVLLY